MSDPSKDRIKRYLKKNINVKIEDKPTQEAKQDFIHKKLFQEAPKESFIPGQEQKDTRPFLQRLRYRVDQMFMNFDGRGFKTFKKETMPLLLFISFSSYILYKMESDYAKMASTVTKVKSQKQQMAEEEDEYIRRHLVAKNKIGENQIQDVPDKRGLYQYEKFKDDDFDEDGDFNTKEDFYDLLRKDFNKGMEIPDQYENAVREYSFMNNKKLKYGEYDDEEDEEENQDIVVGGQANKAMQQNNPNYRPQQ